MRYGTRYERLVANTELAIPDNPQSCWLWTGACGNNGYPRLAVRMPDRPHPVQVAAHRVMLEEVLDAEFPLDEGGHLCCTPRCISPMHLEVQTQSQNLSERRGRYGHVEGCWIPVLFPRVDWLQEAADRAWEGAGEPGDRCPF